jgi:L-methionine (R)-S-oxide reductase
MTRTTPDVFSIPPDPTANFYQHVDGGCYQVLSRGKETESGVEMVAYLHRFPLQPMWSFRTAENFDSMTDGHRRFTPITYEEAQAIMSVDRATAKRTLEAARAAPDGSNPSLSNMVETLTLPETGSKEEIYRALLPQIAAVTDGIDDLVANMANIAAILKQAFDFHWVGFYRTTAPQKLMLGPFQGPLACVVIPFSKGVCGTAAREQTTIIVPDVNAFPGHIACSSL